MFAEREKVSVTEHPEEIKIPDDLKKDSGIEAVETAFKADVRDNGGLLVQTPQNQQSQIVLPKDPQTLTTLSKGPITNSLTWLALFWLRLIKKALKLGKRIVVGGADV